MSGIQIFVSFLITAKSFHYVLAISFHASSEVSINLSKSLGVSFSFNNAYILVLCSVKRIHSNSTCLAFSVLSWQ